MSSLQIIRRFGNKTFERKLTKAIWIIQFCRFHFECCLLSFHSYLFRLKVIYCKLSIFLNGEKMNIIPRLTNVIWKISRYIRKCTSRYDLSSPCRRKFTWDRNDVQETFLFTSKCLDSAYPRLWWNFMELLVTLALEKFLRFFCLSFPEPFFTKINKNTRMPWAAFKKPSIFDRR